MHFGLAALQALLAQLTGADDLVIGLGRVLKAHADVLPVRFKGEIQDTGAQLLEQTKTTIWGSHRYVHQPVKVLLKELGMNRQALLHQVSYNWLSDSTNRPHDTDMYFKNAQDLVVLVREDKHHNFIVFVGLDERLYDKEHAKITAELYVRVLEEMVPGSDIEVGDMDIIPSNIREESMALGAGPKIEGPHIGILQTLQEVTDKSPYTVAQKDISGHQITYAELVKRAVAMASDLKSHGGVAQGTPVCVLGPPTIDLLCSILGIWCAGGIYVPLDRQVSDEENAVVINNCNTDICIVSQPQLIDAALQLGIGTVFDCADMCLIEGFSNVDEPATESTAVIFQVPASNQQLKGVVLPHGNLMALVKSTKYYFEFEKPVVLQHSNWACDLCLFQILFALMSGGTLILAPAINPDVVSRIMVQQNVTTTMGTPSEYSIWFQERIHTLSNCNMWQFAFCSGENLSSAIVRNFAALGISNLELINLYDIAEVSIACCTGVVDYKEYSALWIGDHLGLALPPAWTGYIWVSGPGISGGYIGAVNIDDHGFQAHSDTGARCFRNGDRGFINEAGVLFVVSRHLDESVTLVRGHHVELGDISRAIVDKSSGKVAEAAIILYKENEADDQEEPHIQAFVIIAKAPDADSPPYLQAKLRGLDLPAYMRPTRAVLRESLPRTKDGKTDRRAFDGT